MTQGMLKNSLANFLGAAIPAVANLIAVPLLVHNLGVEDYGLLTLVLALVGYFALLDINATQGSVRFIAEYDAAGRSEQANEVISFSLTIYLIIGSTGLILIWLSAPAMIDHLFAIPEAREGTALVTLRLAGIAFLFSQLQAYLVTIPQAMQQYRISAATEALFGTAAPLLSALVCVLGYGIEMVVLARLVLSVLNVLILWLLVHRLRPDLTFVRATKETAGTLISFSTYSFMARIAAVSHAHMDRLILGMLLGMAHITYYSIPMTLCNRLFGMTYRLGSVIYPAISRLKTRGSLDQVQGMYLTTSRYLTAVNGYLVLIMFVYGKELLRLWVGPEFVREGYPVLVVATTAMMIDSLSNLPSLMNDAIGHPRVTGYFAIARAVTGVGLLTAGTVVAGIIGTAAGHLLGSLLVTGTFLLYVHGRKGSVPVDFKRLLLQAYLPSFVVGSLTAAVASITKPDTPASLPSLLPHGLFVSLLYLILALFLLVNAGHRAWLLARLRIWRAGV